MKKIFHLIFVVLLVCMATACASEGSGQLSPYTVKNESMRISIEITNDTRTYKLSATLSDNSSAEAFYSALKEGPITVDMHDYGSFEKVGSLGRSFPRNDTEITTEPGDIILYQGNQITIYYDENTWSFTLLGKVDSVTSSELRTILGKGNVKAVFSVLEQ